MAKKALAGSGVKVASVATGFPSGSTYTDVKLLETRQAVAAGADEIDMVIDRGAFLEGDYRHVFDEIVGIKEACGDAHLKVILETGELETYDNVRRASILAMAAGADFIKTSHGQGHTRRNSARHPCDARSHSRLSSPNRAHRGHEACGRHSHGEGSHPVPRRALRDTRPALDDPDLFRFGASSLLNDVLMQIRKERTGAYQGPDYFTID